MINTNKDLHTIVLNGENGRLDKILTQLFKDESR